MTSQRGAGGIGSGGLQKRPSAFENCYFNITLIFKLVMSFVGFKLDDVTSNAAEPPSGEEGQRPLLAEALTAGVQ